VTPGVLVMSGLLPTARKDAHVLSRTSTASAWPWGRHTAFTLTPSEVRDSSGLRSSPSFTRCWRGRHATRRERK
jgi:hypothetical protein